MTPVGQSPTLGDGVHHPTVDRALRVSFIAEFAFRFSVAPVKTPFLRRNMRALGFTMKNRGFPCPILRPAARTRDTDRRDDSRISHLDRPRR